MLQRLSEELEYSELLDKASETEDPYERMVLIAAFIVLVVLSRLGESSSAHQRLLRIFRQLWILAGYPNKNEILGQINGVSTFG